VPPPVRPDCSPVLSHLRRIVRSQRQRFALDHKIEFLDVPARYRPLKAPKDDWGQSRATREQRRQARQKPSPTGGGFTYFRLVITASSGCRSLHRRPLWQGATIILISVN
jgi:hypothetical protein